jgi:hypothetical protein
MPVEKKQGLTVNVSCPHCGQHHLVAVSTEKTKHLTVKAAAAMLSVCSKSVDRMIARGEIRLAANMRLGGRGLRRHKLIEEEEILRAMRRSLK